MFFSKFPKHSRATHSTKQQTTRPAQYKGGEREGKKEAKKERNTERTWKEKIAKEREADSF